MTKLRVLRFVLAIIMFNYSFPPVLFAADILSTQKKLYSQHDEELIIRDFFNDEKGGFFVDIGAGDYKELSNTYYLEKNLGWKGVAVDAQERYEADYKKFRPSTRYFNYIVTDGGGSDQDFFNVEQFPATSTTNPNWLRVVPLMVNMKPDEKLRVRITKVPVVTLNKLLELNGITKIDLLSLDIELGEPAALAGFDIDKYRPRLVCV
ncbi:MAG: FkbM family methyltransferase, partial [Candidatus Omnitrophota bacterium]